MDIAITKESLEKQLGYEIEYLKLEPLYDGDTCIGLSVAVTPVRGIKEIKITGNITDFIDE